MADGTVEPAGSPQPTRSLGRNMAVLLGSQVTTWIFSMVMVVMVPRLLGPTAVGQLRIASSLWAIMTVFIAFGTANYLTVEIAKEHGLAAPLAHAARRVRVMVWGVSLPLVAAFVLVAGYERAIVVIIAISAVAALFGLVANVDRAALFGLEQMGVVAKVDVVNEVALTFVVTVVLVAGGGANTYLIVSASVALLTLVMFRRGLNRTAPAAVTTAVKRGFGLLRSGSPYLFADAAVVVYLQVDTLVISLIASESEVGWYAAADAIFGSLFFVPGVLLAATFPRMARIHHLNPGEMAGHVAQAFNTLLIFGVWIGLGTVVVSKSLVRTLFGSDFAGAAPVLAVFGVVAILGYQTILLGQFAVASGRAKFVGYVVFGSAILSVPVDLVLVSWTRDRFDNGAIGGGLAYLVTEGLQMVVEIAVLAPFLLCRATASRVSRCAIAGAAMLLASWPLRDHSFLISGSVASIVYLGVIVLLRTPDRFERDLARQTWTRVRRSVPLLRSVPAGQDDDRPD